MVSYICPHVRLEPHVTSKGTVRKATGEACEGGISLRKCFLSVLSGFLKPRAGVKVFARVREDVAHMRGRTLTSLLWMWITHNGGYLFINCLWGRKQPRHTISNGSRKQSPWGIRSLDVAQGCVVDPDADSSGAWRVVCGT